MKNVMTVCRREFRKIFQIIYSTCCLAATLLLTLCLLLQYMKNEDQSKLLYREFDDSPDLRIDFPKPNFGFYGILKNHRHKKSEFDVGNAKFGIGVVDVLRMVRIILGF